MGAGFRREEGGEGEGNGKGGSPDSLPFIESVFPDAVNAQCWIWKAVLGPESVFRIFHLPPSPSSLKLTLYQTMLSTILGFSAFGFATRVGQLAIQKRPLFSSESPTVKASPRIG
jgi:hypothetical protein